MRVVIKIELPEVGAMLKGWKQICKVAGFCKKTLKKWTETDGFPVTYIGGKAISSRLAIEKWLEKKFQEPRKMQPGKKCFTGSR